MRRSMATLRTRWTGRVQACIGTRRVLELSGCAMFGASTPFATMAKTGTCNASACRRQSSAINCATTNLCAARSIYVALGNDFFIDVSCVVVGFLHVVFFFGLDELQL